MHFGTVGRLKHSGVNILQSVTSSGDFKDKWVRHLVL